MVTALLLCGCMFATFIIAPVVLAQPPYGLSASLVGVAFLSVGVGAFVASPVGGKLADMTAQHFNATPEGRLVAGTALATLLMPASLVAYGWTLQYGVHLAAPLAAHFFVGAAISAYLPGIFSYLSITKQQQAAAASAMVQSLMFISAGVFLLIAVPISDAIGVGGFCTIMAGLVLVSGVVSGTLIARRLKLAAAAAGSACKPIHSFIQQARQQDQVLRQASSPGRQSSEGSKSEGVLLHLHTQTGGTGGAEQV
jgi:predicted MFS family arabinose efflux permease